MDPSQPDHPPDNTPEPPAPPVAPETRGDSAPPDSTPPREPRRLSFAERYERWFMANLTPLLLIVLSLALLVGLRFVPEDKSELRPESEAPAAASPELEPPLNLSEVNLGEICTVGLVLMYFFIPEVRRWFKRFTPRPLPALRAMDLFASFTTSQAAGALLIVIAHVISIRKLTGNALSPRLAAGLIIEDLALLAALFAAIWLARRRAGGSHGSMGLWPFWKLYQGQRSLWQDVLLGASCYPVFLLVGYEFFLPLGRGLVEYFGYHPKPHPLLTAMQVPLQGWVLGVFFVSATIGAPFFEELIFRGVLYNVLRRYLGHWAGALLAAVVFAMLHPVGDWLGIFALGLMLIWLYDKTGRLIASMTLHAFNNTVTMIIALYLEHLQHHLPPK